MKIYWVVSNYPHLQNVQAGIFYKDFAEALVKAGVDLTVIAPAPYAGPLLAAISKKWKTYRLSPFYEEQNGVKIFRPRYFTHPQEVKNGIPHYFMLRAIKKLKLPAPDLVHGFGAYPASYAAVAYALSLGVPSVTTFIGSDVNVFPHLNKKSFNRFDFIVKKSDKVFGVSKSIADEVFKVAGVKAGVVYIPFQPANIPAMTKEEARVKLGIDKDKFIVLFAGYLYETKGVNELCDALEQLKDDKNIHAYFCGGSSPLLERVNRLANSTYAGQLPLTKVMEYMVCADVLVLPSYMEGISSVIKEAAGVGLPVIATNVGGIPELVSDKTGYLIEPKNADQIRDAIVTVRNNYTGALEKAAEMRTEALERFGPEKISDEQISIYSELIQKNKNGG